MYDRIEYTLVKVKDTMEQEEISIEKNKKVNKDTWGTPKPTLCVHRDIIPSVLYRLSIPSSPLLVLTWYWKIYTKVKEWAC